MEGRFEKFDRSPVLLLLFDGLVNTIVEFLYIKLVAKDFDTLSSLLPKQTILFLKVVLKLALS